MGLEQLELKDFPFNDFSAGEFPNTPRHEIPDNGFAACQHVIWFEGRLRRFFGCEKINAAQVDSGANGNGLYHASFGGTNRMIAVFGDKLYENVSGTWTDRTGGMTITDGYPWQFRTFEEGANKYVIMFNGQDASLKWTGAGNNAALLAGSPATALTGDYWHSYFWTNDSTNDNWVVRSASTNPQGWALTTDFFPFPRKVYGVIGNGPRLAAVMEDQMGYIEGFGDDSFNREVNALPIGTKATRSLAKGSYNIETKSGPIDMEGFFAVCPDTVYFINENFQKYDAIPQFRYWWRDNVNKQYIQNSYGCFHWDYYWYVFAVPTADSQWPDTLIVLNTKSGAAWRMPNPLTSTYKIRGLAILKDDYYDDYICILDDNGYAYKFNATLLNYAGGSIQSYAKSKIFDLGATYELREPQIEAKVAGAYDVDLYINFDQGSGDGAYDALSLADTSDLLGSTFVLGASTLGGKEYLFDDLDIAGYGRFVQFMFKDYDTTSQFDIYQLILWMKFIRKGSLR